MGVAVVSTHIFGSNGVQLTRFYGGIGRGTMMQLTVGAYGYVQLSPEDMLELLSNLIEALRNDDKP